MRRLPAVVFLATMMVGCQPKAPEAAGNSTTPPVAPGEAMPASTLHTTAPTVTVTIAKATAANAYTVAEVWAQKGSLAGKSVTIRGVIAKYTAEVMGKNWIHLQDGSGDPSKGTNDITVTSLDTAVKGDTITVSGTVHTNTDLGAGYSYAVLIEDAKLVKH